MPAGQGKDVERFAAAVEQGTPPGYAGDDDLARELEIVAMLRSTAGSAFAPDPDAKARAKQRLMAVVAEQGQLNRGPQGPAGHGPSVQRRPVAPPTAQELTAPIGRVPEPSFPTPRAEIDTAAETTQIAPVAPRRPAADEVDEAAATIPDNPITTAPVARPGRRARHSVASRPAGRARAARRPAPSARRRAALVGAAALVMMLAITGGGIVASRDALPGDSLYALKRVAESAELALTFDDAARAQRHLDIAATRLSEVEQLVARDGGTAADPEVYAAAIQEFDTATGEGSRLLLSTAEAQEVEPAAAATQLDSLRTWVTEQSARLSELRPALPAAADADGSIQLLDLLLGRTEALGARPGCLPAQADCEPPSVVQTGTDAPEPDGTEASRTPGSGSPAPSGSEEQPPGTPGETDDEGGPGLLPLPDLSPDGSGSGDSEGNGSEGEGSGDESSETPAPGGGDGLSVPLPLLPPITLPPLLPGMPPITIG